MPMKREFLALQSDDVPVARGEHNQSPRAARSSSPTGSFVSAANLFLSSKRHSSGRTNATILWQSRIDAKCPRLAAGSKSVVILDDATPALNLAICSEAMQADNDEVKGDVV